MVCPRDCSHTAGEVLRAAAIAGKRASKPAAGPGEVELYLGSCWCFGSRRMQHCPVVGGAGICVWLVLQGKRRGGDSRKEHLVSGPVRQRLEAYWLCAPDEKNVCVCVRWRTQYALLPTPTYVMGHRASCVASGRYAARTGIMHCRNQALSVMLFERSTVSQNA